MSGYISEMGDVTDRLDTIIRLLEGIDEHLAALLEYSEPTDLTPVFESSGINAAKAFDEFAEAVRKAMDDDAS